MQDLVTSGKFRADLFFRVRSLVIEIPPLRERKEAIKEIINYHLEKLCGQRKIAMKDVSAEFWEALEAYSWPGNVRELIHALESAFTMRKETPCCCQFIYLKISVFIKLANRLTDQNFRPTLIRKNCFLLRWNVRKILPALKSLIFKIY